LEKLPYVQEINNIDGAIFFSVDFFNSVARKYWDGWQASRSWPKPLVKVAPEQVFIRYRPTRGHVCFSSKISEYSLRATTNPLDSWENIQ
jgi:hypothetical protein